MERRWSDSAWIFVLGALVGALLTSWIAPSLIAWYFEPPVEFGISCGDPIRWALRRLRKAQFWGLVAGGVVALVLHLVLRRDSRKTSSTSSPRLT